MQIKTTDSELQIKVTDFELKIKIGDSELKIKYLNAFDMLTVFSCRSIWKKIQMAYVNYREKIYWDIN